MSERKPDRVAQDAEDKLHRFLSGLVLKGRISVNDARKMLEELLAAPETANKFCLLADRLYEPLVEAAERTAQLSSDPVSRADCKTALDAVRGKQT